MTSSRTARLRDQDGVVHSDGPFGETISLPPNAVITEPL